MKTRAFLFGICAAMLVVGCSSGAPSGESSGKKETTPSATTTAMTKGDTVDVMAFKGGFGSDFYENAAKEFEEKNKGVHVSIEADPRIWETVQPRFLGGNPPDLTYPGWDFDHWAAAAEGQLMALDEALKEKAYGSETPWADTFESSILKLGTSEGKQYVLPYFFSAMGWWYDPTLFAKNGWTAPKSHAELLALSEKIKAKGMAPITYQGKYPDYVIAGMLDPWIIGAGGMEAFNAIQNLEPGAWKSEAVVKAAAMIKELKDKGYLQAGAAGMTHTEAQTQFVTGKAAMVPCGTWLYAEMEKSMPAGTTMAFMLPPAIADGKGDPTNIMIKIEPWMVPAKAKNQRGAVDYYKYLTSLDKAKQFVKEKGTFMAIKGANDIELPPYLQGAAKAFKDSKAVWAAQWKDWYRELYKAVEVNVTKLLAGDLTPEKFAEECEAAAEKTRKDPDILKHKVE